MLDGKRDEIGPEGSKPKKKKKENPSKEEESQT